ncbi:MAG: hypothetical protein DCC75_06565 [Proteobacteria bacterium]|nr:MAG: hypothetical protein DCC75_06565 [Pseudomonadota bacterium]
MAAIFFDLETSDLNPLGQILNYAFFEVDENLQKRSELCGKIKISRLQLPRAKAIMTNRIDVIQHQLDSEPERVAMPRIFRFLDQAVKRARGKLLLVGYNSAKFDLRYLRTSLIRNGINPYFGGNLIYRDVFQCVRKLALTTAEFPKPREETGRVTLKLECIAREFGLLGGAQSHESKDDVELTIRLALLLKEKFKLDVFKYPAYEPLSLRPSPKRGSVVCVLDTDSQTLDPKSYAKPRSYALLDCDHKYALWIDLQGFKEIGPKPECIRWFSYSTGALVCDPNSTPSKRDLELARKALQDFKGVNLQNFFETSRCDIDQDIYRLDMERISLLHRVIWGGEKGAIGSIKDADTQETFRRYKLSNYEWSLGDYEKSLQAGLSDGDKKARKMLRDYALYRYGGRALLTKSSKGLNWEEDSSGEIYHPTWNELLSEIEEQSRSADSEQTGILRSLRQFYLNSEIYLIAGEELSRIRRIPSTPAKDESEFAPKLGNG